MSMFSLNIQEKFQSLRKKLDQFGYMQPLSVDSLELVESLFSDFIWTTENFRKCKHELNKFKEDPKGSDMSQMMIECSRARKKIIELRSKHEIVVKELQSQVQCLKEEKFKLSLFNAECLDKVSMYQIEVEELSKKIARLQENFGSSTEHCHEMELDDRIPRVRHQDSANTYLCQSENVKSRLSDSASSDQGQLVEAITNKCKELSHQLLRAEEELLISDQKINTYCDKLKSYEREIARLKRDGNGFGYDDHTQINLLRQRNDDLENECLRLKNATLMVTKMNTEKLPNICSNIETQNKKLRLCVDDLLDREKCLLDELRSANCKLSQRASGCIPVIEESLGSEVNGLLRHIRSLEEDRNYWRNEADNHRISNHYQTNEDLTDCQRELKDLISQNNELKQMLNVAERNVSSSPKENDRSRNVDIELKRVSLERDSLQDLVDKFERQLHDVQGNTRVLSQERDHIKNVLDESQRELHDLRQVVLELDSSKKDNRGQSSHLAQSLLRKLELQRDEALTDLHKMTTERDSLRERLKTANMTLLSDKARLSQKIEDSENQKEKMYEEREEMVKKLSILRNNVAELEECNHKIIIRNDSLTERLEMERGRMEVMTAEFQKFENEMQMKVRKESQISEELIDTEGRFLDLKKRSDSQNIELVDLRNNSIQLKDLLKESNQKNEQIQNELDVTCDTLREVQYQLKMKEDTLNDVKVSMNSLEQQLRRIQDANENRDRELRSHIARDEELKKDFIKEVTKYDKLKMDNAALEEDITALTRDRNRLENELRDGHQYIMDLNEEKEQLEQCLVQCQETESEQQRQSEELLDRCRQLTLDNDKLQLSLQRIEVKNEELLEELEAKDKTIRNMKEKMLQTESEMNVLQCNVRNLEEQVLSLRQMLGNDHQAIENQSLEKNEIVKELVAMKDFFCRLENNKDNVQRKLAKKILELDRLKAENSDLTRNNECFQQEIASLQQCLNDLQGHKEFRYQRESNKRIEELETQNDEIIHLLSKLQQLERSLDISNGRNQELEVECDQLRCRLKSEKFKVKCLHRKMIRQQSRNRRRSVSNRCAVIEDNFDLRSECQQDDFDCYSSNSSQNFDQNSMISAGFCTDRNMEFSDQSFCDLLCNHGCYHSRDCKTISPDKRNDDKCSHGCRHSADCLRRKNDKKDSLKKSVNSHSSQLLELLNKTLTGISNSNNHVHKDECGTPTIKHLNPKCPYNEENLLEMKKIYVNEFSQSGILADNNINPFNEKLPTILSETSSFEEGKKDSVVTTTNENSMEINNVLEPRHTNSNLKDTKKENPNHQDNDTKIYLSKTSMDTEGSTRKIKLRSRSLSSKDQNETLPHFVSALTNATALSILSRVSESTRNPPASSTLAQVPSLSSGSNQEQSEFSPNASKNLSDDMDQQVILSTPEVTDGDQTDVSQSLEHSFYDKIDEDNFNENNEIPQSTSTHSISKVYTAATSDSGDEVHDDH